MTWPTEQAREAVVKALAAHWRDMHTNESLGYQRMLAGHALDALAPHVAALVRAERAAALREAADALPAYTEGEGREGIRTWPQSAQGAYSLAVEEAQGALRDRAEAEEAGR